MCKKSFVGDVFRQWHLMVQVGSGPKLPPDNCLRLDEFRRGAALHHTVIFLLSRLLLGLSLLAGH
jgi:hypothetical protein